MTLWLTDSSQQKAFQSYQKLLEKIKAMWNHSSVFSTFYWLWIIVSLLCAFLKKRLSKKKWENDLGGFRDCCALGSPCREVVLWGWQSFVRRRRPLLLLAANFNLVAKKKVVGLSHTPPSFQHGAHRLLHFYIYCPALLSSTLFWKALWFSWQFFTGNFCVLLHTHSPLLVLDNALPNQTVGIRKIAFA